MYITERSHPMPRARKHIRELLDEHEMQVDRVADLERLIQEVCRPPSYSTRRLMQGHQPYRFPVQLQNLDQDTGEANFDSGRSYPRGRVGH